MDGRARHVRRTQSRHHLNRHRRLAQADRRNPLGRLLGRHYLLIAGLAVAARYGFEHKESLEIARKTYVDVNIHDSKNAERVKDLDSLPYSCEALAERLYDDRAIFEAKGVFAPALIDGMIAKLKSYDQTEAEAAKNDPAKMLELVRRYFYCG